MKHIAIIIGHSEQAQGAMNKDGRTEWQYNRSLAALIAYDLAPHVNVSIVHRDCSYSQLPAKVNATGADVAVSLHCNAFNEKASGSEVLYYSGSANGAKLAQRLQDVVVNTLGLPDRGIKPRTADDRGGPLLKGTRMPCVILEPFFIDNSKDLDVGVTRMQGLAGALAEALIYG